MDIMNTLSTGSQAGGFLTDIVGAVKGVANLFGIGTGARRAKKQAQRQFEYDKQLQELAIQQQKEANLELSQYAFDQEVEMWNKQNQYNSPEAQMQRFKQAGLNPALMYGQGTAGNATSLPSYQAPQVSKPQYSNPAEAEMRNLAIYNNIAFQRAQIANMQAQTRKTNFETDKYMPSQMELWQSQQDKLSAEERQIIQNIDQRADLHKFQVENARLQNDYLSGKITTEEFIRQSIQEQTNLTRKQQELVGEEIANIKSKTLLNEINYQREQTMLDYYIPLVIQQKEEELKKLRYENKIDEKSFKARLNEIHAQANRAGVEWQISQEKLSNWQTWHTETDPWYSIAEVMLGGALRFLTKSKPRKTWKKITPTSGGGKTILSKTV